uniref:GTP 3',8-cyclase MoaA n=2 Tax=Hirondellea gigas TaxID=1518452 RepID=A0A6A7GBY5_9CRUS
MKDKYGREINYIRISITEKCNYRCFYCMPQDDDIDVTIAEKEWISSQEIIKLVEMGVQLGIKKVRITGGEPLVRSDIGDILKGISSIEGVEELCITTNGSLLYEKLDILKKYGVTRINISLDTLSSKKFKKITKVGDLERVWLGIKKTLESGIEVRINTVIIKGINDDEVEELANLTKKYKLDLRFIELMPIGEGRNYSGLSGVEIREILKHGGLELYNLNKQEGASEYYTLKDGKGNIGFINPLSNCFCSECNRIRVTSTGDLKQCLNKKSNLNIVEFMRSGIAEEELLEIISNEIYNKPKKHLFNSINEKEEKLNMNKIGG